MSIGADLDADADSVREHDTAIAEAPTREDGSLQDGTRRKSLRHEAQDNGAVTVQNVSYVVEICNVSRYGAQIRVRQGLMPSVGQEVTLQFVNGMSVDGRVVWEQATLVGLQFSEPLPDEMDAVYFEDLGSEYFRAVLRLQILRG